ncbi:MAG TPA: hypothetical protein PKI46_05275, partial [Bacteroidales bacterium]|nr:hypothetical protein [Bacteroidales bacterium]
MKNYKEKLKNITTIILDYDGVMTDGKMYITEDGKEIRAGNVKDGYILQLLMKKGFNVVILSGSHAKSIMWRSKSLKINEIESLLLQFQDYVFDLDSRKTLTDYVRENHIFSLQHILPQLESIADIMIEKKIWSVDFIPIYLLLYCESNLIAERKS